MVETWCAYTSAQGGGGSGEDRLRQLVTTKDMVGGGFTDGDGNGLSVDKATLADHISGTTLAGRASIDPSLAGTDVLGVTDGLTGQVRISPDAFASDAVLKQVVFHEGVHVDQLIGVNFAAYKGSAANSVNEVEAYRKQLAYSLQFSGGDAASEAARASAMYQLSDLLGGLDRSLGGAAYYRQVTSWPYNYALNPNDTCVNCSR